MDMPPLAPPSTENNSVILWVVLVLVLVVVVLAIAKILWSKLQEYDARNREALEKANAKAEAAQAELLKVHGGVMMEQNKTQAGANAAMNRMADVAERMVNFVEKERK